MSPFAFWFLVFVFIILGWIVAGRPSLKELQEEISQLRLERDSQARTIDGQRHIIAELEREFNQAKSQLTQSQENERIVRLDRGRVQEELDKMALALRQLSPEDNAKFRQAYEKANNR